MSERSPARVGEAGGAYIHVLPKFAPGFTVPDTSDVLSGPDEVLIAEHLAELLPTGAAYRTPDGVAFDFNSVMGRVLSGFAGEVARLYRRLFQVALESTASTMTDSLEDWEIELGLPEPCFPADADINRRRDAVIAKLRRGGVITIADYTHLAKRIGFDIQIEEPQPFRAGRSTAGGTEGCGGGERIEFYWIVRVRGAVKNRFHAGLGRAGFTPLSETEIPDELECLFKRLAPAWTKPVFLEE